MVDYSRMDYFSSRQAGRILGFGRATVDKWIRAGHIPATNGPLPSNDYRRVARKDLVRFARRYEFTDALRILCEPLNIGLLVGVPVLLADAIDEYLPDNVRLLEARSLPEAGHLYSESLPGTVLIDMDSLGMDRGYEILNWLLADTRVMDGYARVAVAEPQDQTIRYNSVRCPSLISHVLRSPVDPEHAASLFLPHDAGS